MSKKKKYRNDDEDPRIFSYYPHIAIFALVFFGVSLGVGLSKDIDWLVTTGVVVLAATIAVLSLSKTIWLFWTVAKVMKEKDETKKEGNDDEQSDYYECDDEGKAINAPNADEPKVEKEQASSEEHWESSQLPKNWSRSDKAKVFSLVGAIVLTLLTFMVGIFFANMGITSIGFPIMGAGGGGFALIIIVLIIVGVVQDKRRK